jgi:hypothetical protein
MLSNVYSKSSVINSQGMASITEVLLCEKLIPKLNALGSSGEDFDVFPLLSAATMDFVTAYQFGLGSSSDWLTKNQDMEAFLEYYDGRQQFNFWPQELPNITKWLKSVGIRVVPTWVDSGNQKIEQWTLDKCDGADKFIKNADEHSTKASGDEQVNSPAVYSQLESASSKADTANGVTNDPKYEQFHRLSVASELMDHLAAGFDTSGITLLYFIHEISKKPVWQRTLRKELLGLDNNLDFDKDRTEKEVPSAKLLDGLPVLQATLQETLRLRAAIPGPQPRITPESGCKLGPNGEYEIPGGIRVSAQAHSLHRNEKVFLEAEEWHPERWMVAPESAKFKEMNRWFWAFGSGGRMCIGSNLAFYRKCFPICLLMKRP